MVDMLNVGEGTEIAAVSILTPDEELCEAEADPVTNSRNAYQDSLAYSRDS